MAQFDLPISITYQTDESTPVKEVAAALVAADRAIRDAIALIPSLIDGAYVEHSHVRLLSVVQQSPLREMFAITLVTAFQQDLSVEIPAMIEHVLGINVPSNVDSTVTLLVMLVVFYGADFLANAAAQKLKNGPLKAQLDAIIADLAKRTGKSPEEVKKIVDARYGKPSTVKHLINTVRDFFIPAQRHGGDTIVFDRQRVHPDAIRDIPLPKHQLDEKQLEKYVPFDNVPLEIHAQDKDKMKTGWAAVPHGLCDDRLRMRLVEPLSARDLWNKNTVSGDIVLVSKMTPEGYVPSEIHLLRLTSR